MRFARFACRRCSNTPPPPLLRAATHRHARQQAASEGQLAPRCRSQRRTRSSGFSGSGAACGALGALSRETVVLLRGRGRRPRPTSRRFGACAVAAAAAAVLLLRSLFPPSFACPSVCFSPSFSQSLRAGETRRKINALWAFKFFKGLGN